MSFSLRATSPRPSAAPLWAALVGIGICWGLTGPLTKVAVSAGHSPIALTFWTAIIAALLLSGGLLIAGRGLPLDRRHAVFFLICGFLGTALPNGLSYRAYQELPVGIMMLLLSLVPMATMMISALAGLERPTSGRLAGLALGLLGVALIVLPGSGLPDPDLAIWIVLPLITSLSYAAENVYIARMGKVDLGPFSTLWGLSVGASLLLLPPLIAMGGPFDITVMGPAERATVAIAILHLIAYGGYIWLIAAAGPVFASQVGYVVTATGVVLGMALFAERHSPWVWAAMAVMFMGLFLVQPRERVQTGSQQRSRG